MLVLVGCCGGVWGAAATDEDDGEQTDPYAVGHPTFVSPQSRPIAVNGAFVYVANTPADTVDVIDVELRAVVRRIHVGVDPVSIAVRPDGAEVWVANHISDSVSVIDANPASRTFHEVVATVQDIDPRTLATRFDEPVGIAFASDAKAYVALSPANRIAVVDVATRAVTGHLPIRAQDPRAIAVRGDHLYVIPFESNNQSQLSGCVEEDVGRSDICTFDAVEHVFSNNNVLSTNYDADIIMNPELPDRDLFVFDTETDELVKVARGIGTLLYGLAVDGEGRVFVAQTDARNVENGRAGTLGHGLVEMENRAFLNQITRVDCSTARMCRAPERFDLEPLPPQHPEPGMALATPFGIQVSGDDSTLVVTAAGSDKVFTVDAETGAVLGRVAVEAAPRGVALVSTPEGAPATAWVLNALANSVSRIDLASPDNPTVTATIGLVDPTHPVVKQGRIAFNDADASSTGTFSCESCHPDNHTDQLIWVLDTPPCSGTPGCMNQVPPRLTMPARGLRDTQPYHWDGIPGDPYGGINTRSIDAPEEPNCTVDDPVGCTRVLVDGSMATTMCDMTNCPNNDEGKPGLLDAEDRDALANFVLSVPYPPAPSRPYDNELTQSARDGFFEFSFINDSSGKATGAQTCGACHKMPFLVSTNTPGTGMEAPTWRGAYDRWMVTPQARLNIIDLMNIIIDHVPRFEMDDSFPERAMWILAGATPDIWEMVLQGSTGFSGSFARQLTLNADTATDPEAIRMLRALEKSAAEGAVLLQGEGILFDGDEATPVAVAFEDGRYANRNGTRPFYRSRLIREAKAGNMVLTLTARLGPNVDMDYPQPALWPVAPIAAQTRTVELAFLNDDLTLRINGRHLHEGAAIFVDGRRVEGEVHCETGTLPACDDEILTVALDAAPDPGGLHFLQLQNPGGLFSNDMMFFSEQAPLAPRRGNLITSGGSFDRGARQFQDNNNWNTVEWDGVVNSISERDGATGRDRHVHVDIRRASDRPWHAQISHSVLVVGGQQYTLCYRAKAQGRRPMTAYMDASMDTWANISGGQFRENLTRSWQNFKHTFTVAETDLQGRVAFDFAQSSIDVQIDDIGVYEGDRCGTP